MPPHERQSGEARLDKSAAIHIARPFPTCYNARRSLRALPQSRGMIGCAGEEKERAMATEVRYDAERVGEWGSPVAAEGGSYTVETFTLPDGAKQNLRIWRAAN